MRFSLGVIQLNLILALYFTLVLNFPILHHFYQILSGLEHVDPGFVVSIPLLLLAALNLVFILFSWRYLLKGYFAVLLLVSSVVSYAMFKYGVVFDTGMIQNIAETSGSEASSYLNASVLLWVGLTGLLPAALLLWVPVRYPASPWRGVWQRGLSFLASVALILVIALFYYKDYASVGRNNHQLNREIVPASYLYAGYKYVKNTYLAPPQPFRQIGTDARQAAEGGSKPALLVLVVGETARAQNYALNGYGRPTNPFTARENVISFAQVRSCGTATAVSLPCMFSNMGREQYDGGRAKRQEGLLDVLQHAGISVFWKENDGGCKGVCDRVPNEETRAQEASAYCDGETCFDQVLLDRLPEQVASMRGNRVLVLHLIGSHGPTYFKRYPDSARFFTPDCPRSDIENCSQQELINTYDNTIRYTDQVLAKLIAQLKGMSDEYDTGLLYLSDHGESLGEKGLYLHGTPYGLAPEEQTRVPMLAWFSPTFNQRKQLATDCLRQEAGSQSYSHDNLFHSILGLMDVQTREYQADLDLFKPCRGA